MSCKNINQPFPGMSINGCAILAHKKIAYTSNHMVALGIGPSYSGCGNNLDHPSWATAGGALLRAASSAYEDGVSTLAVRGISNPSPRTISNNICKQTGNVPNVNGLRDMTWMYGQLIDHEVDLTKTQSGGETADILTIIEAEEDYPGRTISFSRSEYIADSNPREQPTAISGYLDATNIYGFSDVRAAALRTFDGTGKLKTVTDDTGGMIPIYNTVGLENAAPPGSTASDFFLSGDIRTNENVALTAMHTLFVREHNRLCDQIVVDTPSYSGKDEIIYQYARNIVMGQMQHITLNEFLPALLGPNAISPYKGYDSSVNAGVKTEFSTVAYRIGHTMLSSNLKIGTSGTLALKDAFFAPAYVQTNGVEDLLLGGCLQVMQEIDGKVVDDVRNFLFGAPTMSAMLDLAALNIQRGRDHGIPGYNDVREAYGLNRLTSYSQITSDSNVQNALNSLYDSVDDIDPWVAGIVESHVTGSNVGPLFTAILKDQFERIRDGDRFWYACNPSISQATRQEIENTKLSDIIIRNCPSINQGDIPSNVFTG